MYYYLEVALRLLLACVLGGVIGAERESEHKNAGLRTHILVCAASTLVMITSEYIFKKYTGLVNIDPARLGAQVISGIGFLGAGAIIKEGVNVKGLTTAASLWAVACVGLACGIGFYEGALLTTFIMLMVLLALKNLRRRIKSGKSVVMVITAKDMPGRIGEIGSIFGKYHVGIENLKITNLDESDYINIELSLLRKELDEHRIEIINEIKMLDGVGTIDDS